MFSYIIGVLAIGLFLANPISQFFYPQPNRVVTGRQNLAPKPRLNESLLALVGPDDTALECPPDTYGARILRKEPLVVYLEGFLSESERRHLLEIRYGSQTLGEQRLRGCM